MRASLVSAACPGFGIRMCLFCKRPWISSASPDCIVTNQYCPGCIPRIAPILHDWELNPDRRPAEERIQARLALLRRQKELSVQQQRIEIQRQRRTA